MNIINLATSKVSIVMDKIWHLNILNSETGEEADKLSVLLNYPRFSFNVSFPTFPLFLDIKGPGAYLIIFNIE